MKYMGAKRALLQNGLGAILDTEARQARRFIDLFAGTGMVSWYVAEQTKLPVVANDLQLFSALLTGSVIERDHPLEPSQVVREWLRPAKNVLKDSVRWEYAQRTEGHVSASAVKAAREICATVPGGPVWTAYGGHYFSPAQAESLDVLLSHLPRDSRLRTLCHASLIQAASRCAAAPGHTAQPFQPTSTALPYIAASWRRDPFEICANQSAQLAARHAVTPGVALTGDANDLALSVQAGDLVFVDPPYSSVQYSRFYHVLETIARGVCGPVDGVGRYPPIAERPQSDYSLKTRALSKLLQLLKVLGDRECRIIVTFPQGRASNGITGEGLIDALRESFEVDASVTASRLSTLGGNNGNRSARRHTPELIIRLRRR